MSKLDELKKELQGLVDKGKITAKQYQDKIDEAISAYDQAEKIKPTKLEIQQKKVNLFTKNNRYKEAEAVLKKIREITLELNNPVVTKAFRLAYEHLTKNNAFYIGIPDDEPIDEIETEVKSNISENSIFKIKNNIVKDS